MKALILTLLLSLALPGVAQEIRPSHRPNAAQRAMIQRGYGMFIHFGVNTFTDDEWSDGTIPVSTYHPTQLDCDQWVRVARDAGFRYVLLITKHHDGFCLWDSPYTTYDVGSSPVPTDVVGAVSQACHKYGLQFAIYYSLWDRHEPTYRSANFDDYITYMERQLTELLTQYGPVQELWFDGGWDRPVADWQLPRLYRHIKRLQPQCVVGVNHTIVDREGSRSHVLPDSMTVDDKYHFQYFPSDFRLWDPMIAHQSDAKQYLHQGQSYYLPFEHTICLSKAWTWFQKRANQPVRDLDELQELFYRCTANDNALVINIPPDHTGRIREYEANTAIALGQRLGLRRGKPLPRDGENISARAHATATSVYPDGHQHYAASSAIDGGMQTRWASTELTPTLTLTWDREEEFNKITLFEYQDASYGPDGFSNVRTSRIQRYQIELWDGHQWTCIYYGTTPMGDCKVIRFPHNYRTRQLRLRVLQATAEPSIYEFSVIRLPHPQP